MIECDQGVPRIRVWRRLCLIPAYCIDYWEAERHCLMATAPMHAAHQPACRIVDSPSKPFIDGQAVASRPMVYAVTTWSGRYITAASAADSSSDMVLRG